MNVKTRFVIPAIITVVVIGIFYYITIPPINIKSVDFWWFVIWCLVVIGVCFGLPRLHDAGSEFVTDFGDTLRREGFLGALTGLFRRRDSSASSSAEGAGDMGEESSGKRRHRKRAKGEKKQHGFIFWIIVLILVLILGLIIGNVASSPFFNARAYSALVQVEDGNFSEDISEISMNSVPVVDKGTAVRLGSRTIGEMSDLVSQFGIDEGYDSYTPINYKNAPYRVAPLVYADPIKWITNTMQGLPGFVTVNMATQDTQLVRLPEGHYMHISTGEHFNNYLYRYVRFQYPTEMFGVAAFELDDDGNPYWIVPTVNMRIGLFGGEDYDGAILVDACTGETTKYDAESVPTWCDKVYTADMVYDQLGYYGRYRGGFWNSLIGQSGVLVPTGSTAPSLFKGKQSDSSADSSTSGYNYLAINDDVYMYTGMTSANSDESLVGFTLVNLRTKQTKYYTCAGATESSAMSSAEGQVQQMSYKATSPLLLNIADRPTYFLSLKDSAGLVKMYAFIDVQQYQIVGTGSTVSEAQKNYITALAKDDQVDVDASEIAKATDVPTITGAVDAIQSVVIDGNTVYYFKLKDDSSIYTATVKVNENLPFVTSGTTVTVSYTEKDHVREVSSLDLG